MSVIAYLTKESTGHEFKNKSKRHKENISSTLQLKSTV